MLQVLENLDFGFKIGGKIFSDIVYADDTSLITCTHDEMSVFLERLHTTSKEFDLEISIFNSYAIYF